MPIVGHCPPYPPYRRWKISVTEHIPIKTQGEYPGFGSTSPLQIALRLKSGRQSPTEGDPPAALPRLHKQSLPPQANKIATLLQGMSYVYIVCQSLRSNSKVKIQNDNPINE